MCAPIYATVCALCCYTIVCMRIFFYLCNTITAIMQLKVVRVAPSPLLTSNRITHTHTHTQTYEKIYKYARTHCLLVARKAIVCKRQFVSKIYCKFAVCTPLRCQCHRATSRTIFHHRAINFDVGSAPWRVED